MNHGRTWIGQRSRLAQVRPAAALTIPAFDDLVFDNLDWRWNRQLDEVAPPGQRAALEPSLAVGATVTQDCAGMRRRRRSCGGEDVERLQVHHQSLDC